MNSFTQTALCAIALVVAAAAHAIVLTKPIRTQPPTQNSRSPVLTPSNQGGGSGGRVPNDPFKRSQFPDDQGRKGGSSGGGSGVPPFVGGAGVGGPGGGVGGSGAGASSNPPLSGSPPGLIDLPLMSSDCPEAATACKAKLCTDFERFLICNPPPRRVTKSLPESK